MREVNDLDSVFAQELLFHTVMLYRDMESFWSEKDRMESLKWISKHMGKDWSVQVLYDKFGRENVLARMAPIVEQRVSQLSTLAEMKELDTTKQMCHLCGKNPPVSAYDFGVAKIISTKKKWGATAASIGLSVAASLASGEIGLYVVGPGKQTTANIVRLSLMVCASCRDDRKGMFGRVKIKQEDYQKHPAVAKGREIGYSQILTAAEIAAYH